MDTTETTDLTGTHPERETRAFRWFDIAMRVLEYGTALIFLGVGAYATLVFLAEFVFDIKIDAEVFHHKLSDLVSYVFLAFVFLELAALFIHQRLSHLLNVVTLVIARKIILAADHGELIIWDVCALALVFGVRKFLMPMRRVRAPFGKRAQPVVIVEPVDSMRPDA